MKLENITLITELERDAADVASCEQDRQAFALLQLALQGEADIAAGRTVTRAEHKKRLAVRLKARKPT